MPFAGEIHYRRSDRNNQGRVPLILIHGAGGSYLYWSPEIRHLSKEDVMAIDLPGHGASAGVAREAIDAYAGDVIGLLDNLGIAQAIIIGHSMGGAIAQQLSLDYPERVQALILIGAGAKLRVHSKLIQLCSNESTYPEAASMIMEWAFSPQADRRQVELAGKRLQELPASVLLDDLTACDLFDVRDQVGQIMQPTLVMCGEDDRMTPVRFSQYLADKIPNSRLEIIPSAGHMVMLEEPEIVAKLIKDFLTELESGDLF